MRKLFVMEESAKKQKLEDDTEKEELRFYLNIVLEEESLNIESLATNWLQVASSGWPFVLTVPVVLVVVLSEGSSIIKLSFANEFHQDKASSVRVPVANLTLQSLVDSSYTLCSSFLATWFLFVGVPCGIIKYLSVAACASSYTTLSAIVLDGGMSSMSGGGVVDLIGDEDPTDEDGDNDIGGKNSSGYKKSRDQMWCMCNTGDGGKTVGGAIGACGSGIGDSLLVALYACMTFILQIIVEG
ncbi:hypothetical protein Tco_1193696 [Tanacetum coccineum]